MKYGYPYWNIKDLLPYQRAFNFINGVRSIGKTYTTYGFMIERYLKHDERWIMIVRTKKEKEQGIFKKATDKVISKEFGEYTFRFTDDEMAIKCGEVTKTIGYCVALSESADLKKYGFYNVRWGCMDEYMLESDVNRKSYVGGWNEPNLLLSIYHTLDRDEDYLQLFLLGNNTSFYNPYHLHEAFNIPYVGKGDIWLGKNCLFQWVQETEGVKNIKAQSKFSQMIEGTTYDSYANKGNYFLDNPFFIQKKTNTARFKFSIMYAGELFGIWNDMKNKLVFVCTKVPKDYEDFKIYSMTLQDHSPNTLLWHKASLDLKWLGDCVRLGRVRFDSMKSKKKFEGVVKWIV